MDLSKLPRLSETSKQASPPAPRAEDLRRTTPTEAFLPAGATTSEAAGPEAWISLAIGLILLLLYRRFPEWLSSRLFGTRFNEFMLNGAVVPYPQVPEFWADLGPFLFALMLIVEGISFLALARYPKLGWVAFGFTCLCVAYNAIYVVGSFAEYGLALISALAVVFGVWIALHQWKLLQLARAV